MTYYYISIGFRNRFGFFFIFSSATSRPVCGDGDGLVWKYLYADISIIHLIRLFNCSVSRCAQRECECVCVCMGKRDNNIGLGQITFDQITSWQIER